MKKSLYEVTVTKDGYIVHKSYQVAMDENEAIDLVKFRLPPKMKYDSIRASYVRPE